MTRSRSVNDSGRWVVRHVYPTRQRVLVLVSVVAVLLALTAVFEMGRWRAGYDRSTALIRYEELEARYNELKDQHEGLKNQIARLETNQDVDEMAYKGVEDALIALRDRLRDQQEELEFYRSIVSPSTGEMGLRVHELTVAASAAPRQYRVHLILARTGGRENSVSGSLRVTIEGVQNGVSKKLSMSEISDTQDVESFSFKYFQDFTNDVVLPETFMPQTIHVAVQPHGGKTERIEQSFIWPDSQRQAQSNKTT